MHRILVTTILFAVLSIFDSATARCADDAFRETFSVRTDDAVTKQVADVREYVRTKRWEQAADLLVRIARDRGGAMVAADEGWYVNVAHFCNRLAAGLPAEGLAAYRKKIDRQAKAWLDEAARSGDESLLHRIVNLAFCSRWGDDAVLKLAETSWGRGDVALARRYWSLLRPANGSGSRLVFPDPSIKPPEIAARLILCDVVAGDRARAAGGLAGFRKRYPQARGSIAGKTGKLADILTGVFRDSSDWKPPSTGDNWPTFAGNIARNGQAKAPLDVGAPVWSKPISTRELRSDLTDGPAKRSPWPTTYPVVWKDHIFVAEAGTISGYRLDRGTAAFTDPDAGAGINGEILYSVGFTGLPRPTEDVAGGACFSLTIAGGRLFARMGSPVTGRAKDELRAVRSRLVCLDLDRKQGQRVWEVKSRVLGPGFEFEGSPIVVKDRLYVALRQRTPATRLHVAAFDAKTGKPLWTTPIGSAIVTAAESANHVTRLLLSYAEGRLFFSTNAGAVAAVDVHDGRLLWVATWSAKVTKPTHKVTPGVCLVHRGRVFAAPDGADALFAFDAVSGRRLWQRRLRGGARHLLGVVNNRLIASGDRLWGLDTGTGKVAWTVGFVNPASFGFGRGVIAGESIYQPLRREILVVNGNTGRLTRRINLAGRRGGRGGNLIISNGRLIVAEPNRLRVYGTRPLVPRKGKAE